jgi:uncharacterized membrane protein YphA (DoxX/SURF4 family)
VSPGTRVPGAGRFGLQRLFSSFPNGAPGLGLLLLRLAVGASLLVESVHAASDRVAASWSGALAALSIADACALVTGTLTPAAGLLAAALSLVHRLALSEAGGGLDDTATLALLLVMSVTVALLGPGAYSVDARLFGRREIVVPRAERGRGRDDE